jgi:hypothetical protein
LSVATFVGLFVTGRMIRIRWGLAGGWGETAIALVWLAISLGLPMVMMIGRDVIGARSLAREPAECWTPSA